MTKLLKN